MGVDFRTHEFCDFDFGFDAGCYLVYCAIEDVFGADAANDFEVFLFSWRLNLFPRDA
jgi:hypothetical protein